MTTAQHAPAASFLKGLARRLGVSWRFAVLPQSLDGTQRLETLRTQYVFENGICTQIVRRMDEGSVDTRTLGMRLVGWVIEEGDSRELLSEWRTGAKAVLWRAPEPDEAEGTIAMTSRSFALVSESDPPRSGVRSVRPEGLVVQPPAPSMTRIDHAVAR
jgi:hypothetical protein